MHLLDGCCGGGGIGMGYAKHFTVTGVDVEHHDAYPFEQVTADIREVLADQSFMARFDAVHVSPPCPRFSIATPRLERAKHPDIVAEVRDLLDAWGGPWVMENVPRAPLRKPVLLCGASFGLGALCRDGRWRPLRRHRHFETNFGMEGTGCSCSGREALGVYGNGGPGKRRPGSGSGGYKGTAEEMREAMGIDWITSRDDLTDAVPPAYGRYAGARLARQVMSRA